MQRTISLCLAAAIMSTTQAVMVEDGEWVPNTCQQNAIDIFQEEIEFCKEDVVVDEDDVADCQLQCAEDDGGCRWRCEHHDPYQYCYHRAHVEKKHAMDMCWVTANKEFNKCMDKLLKTLKKQQLKCLKKHEKSGTAIENAKADCEAQRKQSHDEGKKECQAIY